MTSTLAADDPLAGILSDGSDDSFFDDPKTLARKTSLTKPPDKKSVNDLFNVSDEKADEKTEPSAVKMDDDWLGLGSSISRSKDSGFETERPTTTPALQTKPKKISFEDDDDILGTLGFNKKSIDKTEEKKVPEPSKKSNLLDSIFGSPKKDDKKITSFEDILKDSKATHVAKSTDTKSQPSSISIKSETQTQSAPAFSSLDATRGGRRGRRNSGGLMDPLGLFSGESKTGSVAPAGDSREQRPKTSEDSSGLKIETLFSSKPKDTPLAKGSHTSQDQSLPDWLAGGSAKIIKSEQPQPTKQTKVQENAAEAIPVQQQSLSKSVEERTEIVPPQLPSDIESHMVPSLLAQQKLVHSNIEYQNTAMALQQQETQLLMALQLKKYEENLAAMQQQQQELLVKQEQQFNILLERQFTKQQAMENSMKLQQERINNHMQLLLSQPPLPKTVLQEEVEELEKTVKDEDAKLYEHMLDSLRKRQHEELFLLEESYKKQISLLEQTMESVETRLKDEVSRLSENYEDRIKQIKQNHEEELKKSSERLRELEQYHLEEIKQVRENHNRIIEEVKYEHNSIIETLKNAKQTEDTVFKDVTTYAEKLDNNMHALYSSSKLLQEIQDKVHKDYGVLSLAREESLKAKEKEIADMRATLDKCREAADLERTQLMGLVRSLETKLLEQNQAAKEDRWAFQQAAATLVARSAALDRETEFNRNALEREKEQMKTLKETMLAEQERIILQLTEEKLAFAAEKSRLETSNKLAASYDVQRNKAEIDAALQVAKEAAELADKEREKLHQQQAEIETIKRSLKDKERTLKVRENEMRNLIHSADRRIQEAERRMQEARLIESKYNDKFRELQGQLSSLSRREKKLSDEKISLSKERLALHTLIREKRSCGLCAADQPKMEEHSSYHEISQDIPRVMNMVDRDLVRFRMEVTEDEQDDTLAGGNMSI